MIRRSIEGIRSSPLGAARLDNRSLCANRAAVVQRNMTDGKHPGGAGKRRPAPPRKEPSWTALLIRLGIAIALFNIVAGILAWYFVFSPRKH